VRRSDGRQRCDSTVKPEPRNGVARVEAAHAVRDDVDSFPR
jgi:hypothetical protein